MSWVSRVGICNLTLRVMAQTKEVAFVPLREVQQTLECALSMCVCLCTHTSLQASVRRHNETPVCPCPTILVSRSSKGTLLVRSDSFLHHSPSFAAFGLVAVSTA